MRAATMGARLGRQHRKAAGGAAEGLSNAWAKAAGGKEARVGMAPKRHR
jgi:hypothetical protein